MLKTKWITSYQPAFLQRQLRKKICVRQITSSSTGSLRRRARRTCTGPEVSTRRWRTLTSARWVMTMMATMTMIMMVTKMTGETLDVCSDKRKPREEREETGEIEDIDEIDKIEEIKEIEQIEK